MEQVATQYFKNLFQSSAPQVEDIEKVLEAIPARISAEQNRNLTKQFSREEVHSVIKGMPQPKHLARMTFRPSSIKSTGMWWERNFFFFFEKRNYIKEN